MIALITGIGGFVGPHLKKELLSHGYKVYGVDLNPCAEDDTFLCDITNPESVENIIHKIHPDCIFHLAGFSSVAKSFEKPELCHNINVNGTKNLLDALIKTGISPKILIISSSEVYGKPLYNPIDEKHPLNPVSPYGKSRVAQEELCKQYNLSIIIARSFSHTGEGQQETFVIPSFKKQIKDAKNNDIIYVGNLDVIRDFSDVTDVVKTYRILIEKGKAGEVYNVGSGIEYSVKEILDELIHNSGKKLRVEIDLKKYRPTDIEKQICNPQKIQGLINWKFKRII